ncbi:STAS domain-containing protein [Marivirga harenae]|uniref:STAS domain-containing protein n=1 Tax=Marivirga harenae TaxID=2010992 RepID=UPI0026DEF605|nr:STAS domain-containing protein [Marivirga harenae]WKV13768.1 STAS domain-containing protein [Marivirga harenae]|tara:strand:- start:66183 stop:66536 length:354 start_codon:yes stop_codon:yes gene_type:complete
MINITTEIEREDHILKIEGDVDASSSIHLDEALTVLANNSAVKFILVDGTNLNYISSAGLGVFMSYIDDFKNKNIKMVIYGLSEKVLNVFQILGLDQLMIIVTDKQTAKKKLHEVQS